MAFVSKQPEIIYEDKEVLVVYKPAGLATQTSKVGEKDVVSELKKHLKGGYLAVIHRLDQPVEGLLVFAKDSKSAAALSKQVAQKADESGFLKDYSAVVCGQSVSLKSEPGNMHRLENYLIKQGNVAAIVEDSKSQSDGVKKAILEYEIISTKGDFSLLKVHLETGRFHQIRVQLSANGTPILGDSKYGNDDSLALSQKLGVRYVALCADCLKFVHPKTGKLMEFKCEPKGDIFKEFS